jgi:hypothetical protein
VVVVGVVVMAIVVLCVIVVVRLIGFVGSAAEVVKFVVGIVEGAKT